MAKFTPETTRHVFLIRHGQYNQEGKTDEENYLTPLGREQAALTGDRMAVLLANLRSRYDITCLVFELKVFLGHNLL